MFRKFLDDFFVYTYIRFFIVLPWYYKYLYTLSLRKKYIAVGTASVLVSLLIVHLLTPTVAASTWIQTSDSDFGAGTKTSVSVTGSGPSASITLNGGTFTKRRSVTIDNTTPTGTYITKWGSQGSGDGQFNVPFDVATDNVGNVYVLDYSNFRIQKFNSSGNFITKWGSAGSGNGQLSNSGGIGVDSAGNVYVADQYNERVQKFTSSGTYITKWGSAGSGNGQFNKPTDVAIDSAGNVYVTDLYNKRVQKFTSSGTYITQWGSAGSGNGQFQMPSGIAVDGTGNVYVTDQYSGNSSVQKFSSTGTFLAKWGSNGSGNGQFSFPYGIAIDQSGNVYVADGYNNRIQKFDSSGNFITKWGSSGTGNGQFNTPIGVAVDSSGSAYVADWQNHRIQKFSTNQPYTNNRVQINLTSSNFDFSLAQSDGRDIRFLDSDASTYLQYWIQSWDAGAQTATVWVRVPSIATESTKTVYLYYVNSGVTTETNSSVSSDPNSGLSTSVGSSSTVSQVIYSPNGTIISSAFNTGQLSDFSTISWTATTPGSSAISFQLRSASTEGGLSGATWYGPTGTGDSYTSSGATINSVHDEGTWVQYSAKLISGGITVTPILNDVSIGYGRVSRTFTTPTTIGGNGTTYAVNNLTVDGTTVTVAGGTTLDIEGTLSIINNGTLLLQSTNTNADSGGAGVTINAADVSIASGSTISANGQGYAATHGPGVSPATGPYTENGGAGYGGVGGKGNPGGALGGSTYGSSVAPTDLGSGSGMSWDVTGGAGGGAIRLVVTGTLTNNGTITANGGNGTATCCALTGGGSGGSVYVTTGTLTGSGIFTANGGNGGGSSRAGGGGGGRIAIYYAINSSFGGFITTVASGGSGGNVGSPGTVGFFNTSGINDSLTTYQNFSFPSSTTVTYGSLTVKNGSTLTVGGGSNITVADANTLTVTENSTILLQGTNTTADSGGVGVTISAVNAIIDSGSKISADGQGYTAVLAGNGHGPGGGVGSSGGGGGGGYGGAGGTGGGGTGGAGGISYGSSTAPTDLGSAGGGRQGCCSGTGGAGGGAIRLSISGTLTLNGAITANGANYALDVSGGGSGGSIYVTTGTLTGSGSFTASGGTGAGGGGGGGGGGGRIAVYYTTNTFTGTSTASGGSGNSTGSTGSSSVSYQAPVVPPTPSNVSGTSDTLSNSNLGVTANHTIQYTTLNGIAPGETILITFPNGFILSGSLDYADIDFVAGGTNITLASSASGATRGVLVNAGARTITITSDTGSVAANTTIQILIGTNASYQSTGIHQITNPNSTGSYNILVGGTQVDSGDTWVAILPQVVMSGSVSSTFQFSITPITGGGLVNGTATNITPTQTTIPFGSLNPGTIYTAGYTLSAIGNPNNGFTVTMNQDGDVRSRGKTGATINSFNPATDVPATWSSPSANLSDTRTWGSIGITTNDPDVTIGGQGFVNGSNPRWTGFNTTSNILIFNATSSADGVTQGNGSAAFGIRMQTTALQPAANDYQAQIRFVATPRF